MSLNVGTIYKRVILSILFFIILLVLICTFTKYKICRFPFDVIYAPSKSVIQSKKLGVFQAEYIPIEKEIEFDSTKVAFKKIWVERFWYSKRFTNEVNPESLKNPSNIIILKFEEKKKFKFHQIEYSLTIINKNQVFSRSSLFSSLNHSLSCKTMELPDTLKFIVHDSFDVFKSEVIYETLLIKK